MLKASARRRTQEACPSHRGSRARLFWGQVDPQGGWRDIASTRPEKRLSIHCSLPSLRLSVPFRSSHRPPSGGAHLAIRHPGPCCTQQVHHTCCISLRSLVQSRILAFFCGGLRPAFQYDLHLSFQHERDFWIVEPHVLFSEL